MMQSAGSSHWLSARPMKGVEAMTRLKMISLFVAILACVVCRLYGQEARGTLMGRVSDPTGSVIIGAKVEAVNAETGVHFTSTTKAVATLYIAIPDPRPK
jgi:hypothetical protein